jgi:hypothetical protein
MMAMDPSYPMLMAFLESLSLSLQRCSAGVSNMDLTLALLTTPYCIYCIVHIRRYVR